MKSTVKVTANEKGQVVIQGAKPEYGYIRVESSHTSMENGFLNTNKRSAIIGGKMADLTAAGFTVGQELSGKIVVKEQLTPFYEEQAPKINPTSKEVIKVGGQPVYRQTFYTNDLTAVDSLLQADNVKSAASVKITA